MSCLHAGNSSLDLQRWIGWVCGPPHSGIALYSVRWCPHLACGCSALGRTRGLCEHRACRRWLPQIVQLGIRSKCCVWGTAAPWGAESAVCIPRGAWLCKRLWPVSVGIGKSRPVVVASTVKWPGEAPKGSSVTAERQTCQSVASGRSVRAAGFSR